MTEKKTTKTTKTTVAKKTTATTRKCTKKNAVVIPLTAENAGFRAGDVYQALAANNTAMSLDEIAKAANITPEATLLGMGWLFKEGKIVEVGEKVALA